MADKEKTAKTGQEKRVVFFENNSWYHRTKELMDDMTVKYSKKGGFQTPEEAAGISSCLFEEQGCDVWGLPDVLV